MADTNIRSQTFIVHADNDLLHKSYTCMLEIVSTNKIYRNFRFTEDGVEPFEFNLTGMVWNGSLRMPVQIIPTPSTVNKTFVTYSNYGNDVVNSENENKYDLEYKGEIPMYLIDRMTHYGFDSDLYVTDFNDKRYDNYVRKRLVFDESISFEITRGSNTMFAPVFKTKDYYDLGANSRIEF